ncbi:hypothetical protein J4221_04240 [Candidatus Pacearchaeota archaeon]|nr:hypothetical protein [Candidatus Pacearchaeota archaeon]
METLKKERHQKERKDLTSNIIEKSERVAEHLSERVAEHLRQYPDKIPPEISLYNADANILEQVRDFLQESLRNKGLKYKRPDRDEDIKVVIGYKEEEYNVDVGYYLRTYDSLRNK